MRQGSLGKINATEIRLRAERRLGELLKQIPANEKGGGHYVGTDTVSRSSAATDAGMSERQKVTA